MASQRARADIHRRAQDGARQRFFTQFVVARVVAATEGIAVALVHGHEAQQASSVCPTSDFTGCVHGGGGQAVQLQAVLERVAHADVERGRNGDQLPQRQARFGLHHVEAGGGQIARRVLPTRREGTERRDQANESLPVEHGVVQVHADGGSDLGGDGGNGGLQCGWQTKGRRGAEPVGQPTTGNGAVAERAGIGFEARFQCEDGTVAAAQVFIAFEPEA